MMDDGGNERQAPDGSDDLARRQAALHALAQSQTQQLATDGAHGATPPPAAPAAPTRATSAAPSARSAPPSALAARIISRPPGSGRRRGAIIGVALLVIVVVVVGAAVGVHFALGQRAAAPAAKPVLRLNPAGDNCITSVAWSPDGKQIAALGNTQGCTGSQSDAQTGAVFVYNAQSGKLVQQLQPDVLVFKSPAVETMISAATSPNSGPASLFYQGMVWAPDGQSLLLPFNEFVPQANTSTAPVGINNGLLRLATGHTTTSQVLFSSNTGFSNNSIQRWDLTSGLGGLAPAPPTATAYTWTRDDALVAADSATGQPIGTPDGGQTFAIWQPGTLQYFQSFQSGSNPQTTVDAQDILWNASAPTVSPDGGYLYTYFPSYGSLVPPSTRQDGSGQPKLAPRDPALLALAQQMSQATTPDPNAQFIVAWRPDGRQLAAISVEENQNQGQNGSGAAPAPGKLTVSIYDTTMGKLIKRLTPDFGGLLPSDAGQGTLAWSPDGSHLLLADNVYGAITIWGPGALPK